MRACRTMLALALTLACASAPGAHAAEGTAEAAALAELARLPGLDELPPPADADRTVNARLETHLFARDWRASRWLAASAQPATGLRTAMDLRGEWRWTPTARFVLSNRLDHVWHDDERLGDADLRHALREAYASLTVGADRYLDVGRINLRQGVASGYNPTDFFRDHATVTSVSEDPGARRENRIGTVALRAQQLWSTLAASLVWSPRLADARDDDAAFADDLGRTNRRQRVQFRVSLPTGEQVGSELLVGRASGQQPWFGTNLTGLLGAGTILHFEWAAGAMHSLFDRAALSLDRPASTGAHWRNRLATGMTHTFANRLSATLEFQYDGSAATRREWRDLIAAARHDLAQANRYRAIRALASADVDALTRRALFGRLAWSDAVGIDNLDVAALARKNLDDRSALLQLEATWHRHANHSLSLQWVQFTGAPGSEYGELPGRRTLSLRSYWYW